jgi:hypothetical protein
MITVKCRKRQDTGDITNEIAGYAKKESSAPPMAAAAASSVAPWKRS